MLKFAFRPRFSRFDIAFILVASAIWTSVGLFPALVVLGIGVIVSAWGEEAAERES